MSIFTNQFSQFFPVKDLFLSSNNKEASLVKNVLTALIEQIVFWNKNVFYSKVLPRKLSRQTKNLHMNTMCFKIETLIS